jgi:type II secretory pathway pseudopilin PulG
MTYIEMIVSFAIVLAILTLLTPAFLRARSAARRVACLNNIKQLGLALCNYHALYECLPAGRMARESPTYGGGVSAHFSLMPFLDQVPYYHEIKDAPTAESIPLIAVPWMLPIVCRDDPSSNLLPSNIQDLNYLFNTGDTYPVSVRNPLGVPVTGPFFENSFLKYEEIEDGLSCTVFLGETVRLHSAPPRWSTAPAAGWRQAIPTANNYPQLVNPTEQCLPTGPLIMVRGMHGFFGGPGTSLYNHVRTPNPPTDDCRDGSPSAAATPSERARLSHDTAARSWHRGGVNAGMGDGSVRMIGSNIDPQIWRNLGNRSDGEDNSGY